MTTYSYINYAEGIYVGYKYYETRYEDAVLGRFNAGDYDYGKVVVYPFGYGLSYTTFEWSDFTVSESGGVYTASVTVKNTGSAIGNDAVATNTSGWYAPGINIHRTAFGARNYEYYFEDAVLTGLCAAAVTRGAEAKGIHVYLKHFAMNDQDTNRAANNCVSTWSTEQAAQEIYLKPFQYSIEKGGAQGIMLTMSRVGYRYSYGSYPMMTAICRNEWGFNGCYITDYTTTMKGEGSDMYLAAGGNLIHATAEQTLSDVKQNWCRALLREDAHSILYNTANSLAMNGIGKGVKSVGGFAVYKIFLIALDAVVLLIVGIGAFNVYSKVPMTEEAFQNRRRWSKQQKLVMWIIIGVIVIALAVVFTVWALPLLEKALKI